MRIIPLGHPVNHANKVQFPSFVAVLAEFCVCGMLQYHVLHNIQWNYCAVLMNIRSPITQSSDKLPSSGASVQCRKDDSAEPL